jgi:CBS domain-containing protein
MINITAQTLLKTDSIIRGTTEMTLNEALAQLTRSHDALFVFNPKGKFEGIISPYYVIFKSKFPPKTKLENCLYRPPILSPDTIIWDIAKLMIEAKVYFLPVMSNNTFLGIVTVNRLLRAVEKSKDREPIAIATSNRLITISKKATLSDAYQLMKDKQISRLPVVSETEKLVGIATRYDIQQAFSEPQKKPRFLSRMGNKQSLTDQPLEKYYKKMVVTLPQDTNGNKIVEMLLTHNVGSVVLIDKNRKPQSIVSTHDILQAISRQRPKTGSHVSIEAPDDFIYTVQLQELLSKHTKKFMERYRMRRIVVHVSLHKNASGDIRQYTVQIQAINNEQRVSNDSNFDWKIAARGALEKMDKQLRREYRSFRPTARRHR